MRRGDPLPGATANGVSAETVDLDGRRALRVVLSPERRAGALGVDFGDEPTFLLLPDRLADGAIEVDVLARLLPDAPDYARGFIGIAFRVRDGGARYESVYLRPLNGGRLSPPAPRDARAVQYYAYPDWKFDRLRETDPGRFEAGADILPDRWSRLRVEIAGRRFSVLVDGEEVLSGEGEVDPAECRIGLRVDIGTEGYFADLVLSPR